LLEFIISSGFSCLPLGELKGDDLKLSKTMVDFWVDFISTGNPNILQGQWSPFEKEHKYLNISGLHSFMGNSENLHERMALWEDIMSNKTSLETTTLISTTTDSGATKINSTFIFLIMFFFAITGYFCNPCK
jgi:hypothetical protein